MREAAAVFAAAAALGIFQSAPSVTTGDAGELAAAAAVWGVPHAPGYASWTVLARAFGLLLPLGDWAHRAALLSAVCGAAALALLCDALRRQGVSRPARLTAAVVLGLSPVWRELSSVAEVFMPLMLAAAALYWIVAAAGDRLLDDGPAACLGLVLGLGVGLHQTLVLVVPALLLAGRGKRGSWPRALSFAAAGFAAGFAVHLAIPLRAVKSPPVDWDHAIDRTRFVHLLLRKDYGTGSLTVDGSRSLSFDEGWKQCFRVLSFVWRSYGWVGCCCLLAGLVRRRSSPSRPPFVPLLWFVAAGPLFLLMGRPGFDAQTNGALERFYLLPLFGLAPIVAYGVSRVSFWNGRTEWVLLASATAFSFGNGLAASRRDDYLAYDYGRNILRELPPSSLLLMDGGDDTFYSLMFLREASGLRRDLELRDRGGVVFPGLYGPDFRALTKDEKRERRLTVERARLATGRLYLSTLDDGMLPGAALAPAGLLRRPIGPKESFPEGRALSATLAIRPSAGAGYRDRALAAFVPYQRGLDSLARGDAEAGSAWLESAAATAPDALWTVPAVSYALGVSGFRAVERKDWAAAEHAYRAAAAVEPAKAEPQTNLGVALERAGRVAEAEAAFREAVRREPRSPKPWAALGARLWAGARWADASAAFASAAALDPSDARSASWSAEAARRAKAAAR